MTRRKAHAPASPVRTQLTKAPTGIEGLDEITFGGLPTGRTTLLYGSAGCGKTLLAMEFIVRGAMQFNEPGVFVAFEESATELAENVASLGFDLNGLIARQQVVVDAVRIDRTDIEEAGDYDLEGLFIRLGQAIESIGAKRVVLDTIESLFAGLPNPLIMRRRPGEKLIETLLHGVGIGVWQPVAADVENVRLEPPALVQRGAKSHQPPASASTRSIVYGSCAGGISMRSATIMAKPRPSAC
jgi:hypothetical protein